MVDLDAAIGFVTAHGDDVDRARLAWLCSHTEPAGEILVRAELGQSPTGGWPASWAGEVASVDATCFHLAELDDLAGLERPAASAALAWLAARQGPDGYWEEDAALAASAPEWARPGDPEARLYLTANAAFWLSVTAPRSGGGRHAAVPEPVQSGVDRAAALERAVQVLAAAVHEDGTWPSYLVTGWLAAAALYRAGWYHPSGRIQVVLAGRLPAMTAADAASAGGALRRAGLSTEDFVVKAALTRLAQTQRDDGGWDSDDGNAFDVHTTLAAIRAALPEPPP